MFYIYEKWRAGPFFAVRLRFQFRSLCCNSSWGTDRTFRTVASNFSASDCLFIAACSSIAFSLSTS